MLLPSVESEGLGGQHGSLENPIFRTPKRFDSKSARERHKPIISRVVGRCQKRGPREQLCTPDYPLEQGNATNVTQSFVWQPARTGSCKDENAQAHAHRSITPAATSASRCGSSDHSGRPQRTAISSRLVWPSAWEMRSSKSFTEAVLPLILVWG